MRHGWMLMLAACAFPVTPGEEFIDGDGDGWFVNAIAEADRDCDDARRQVHPGATEICNGVDDDCDGEVDDAAAGALEWYIDRDGDGFGVAELEAMVKACNRPRGYSGNGRDCDDEDPTVWRGCDTGD